MRPFEDGRIDRPLPVKVPDTTISIASLNGDAVLFDTRGHAIFSGIDVQDDDLVVYKLRFGTLGPEHCSLNAELVRRGIDTVVIAGTLTNVGCESTARQAMELDYRALFVADATAARNEAAQSAALLNVFAAFGNVAATDQICARLCAANR